MKHTLAFPLILTILVPLMGADCGGVGSTPQDFSGTQPDLARADGQAGDMGLVTASFASLYGDYLGTCASCHAPGAPGRTSDIEMTLDFSSKTTAYTTLMGGSATGLTGPTMACNGVRFVLPGKPGDSLALAVLDENVRGTFDLPAAASCDKLTITDETVKVGTAPSAPFLVAFRDWIQNGALDN